MPTATPLERLQEIWRQCWQEDSGTRRRRDWFDALRDGELAVLLAQAGMNEATRRPRRLILMGGVDLEPLLLSIFANPLDELVLATTDLALASAWEAHDPGRAADAVRPRLDDWAAAANRSAPATVREQSSSCA
jgi:hypothetical protein